MSEARISGPDVVEAAGVPQQQPEARPGERMHIRSNEARAAAPRL